ncbi:chorismate mutase [Actinokineospora sp. UTMC 2448]|uniref:chorismate mutase n=1 Tax=Actinokineospora sp. UTMC 2448 TaxID=2268449 RepID=UPI002164BA8E|nr:chorismate mutase [Actinokineospora sp. UTMC 2448]UVS81467.1 Chorismate mutase AroH [Actinokineospora sp. UTMC 2448]
MIAVRAVRGAVQVDRDDPDVVFTETRALVLEVIRRNGLATEDIISIFFTVTPDIKSGFPAAAARAVGLTDVPMLCATEIDVPNSMTRVIRLLAHVQTDRTTRIEHVYLRGAAALRPDLADPGTSPPRTGTAGS